MTPDPNPTPDNTATPTETTDEPVAYDKQGRPLYLHPPAEAQAPVQAVYTSRPLEPRQPIISERIKQLHEQSCKQFPQLNLSNGEYVLSSLKRHPVGLLWIWLTSFVLIAAPATVLLAAMSDGAITGLSDAATMGSFTGLGLVAILVAIGALASSYIYNNNRFYLTNESVVQEIQSSLFNKREQTVSLSNIEDASYRQDGIFPVMFNYGTIRLSTEGDETTYRFTYVSNPKQHIALLNDAVESFKNGRPIEPPHQDQPS